MKNTKRILACFLAVLMTLSCFTVMSVGADNAPSESASVYDPNVTATLSDAVDGVVYIDSANEFMAFSQAIVNNNNFAGITVKLTCDVVINQGDVSTWTNPYEWNACSNNWWGRFAGSFDGQGHTISGIYNKHAKEAGLFGRVTGGNTIQNVNIVNSYFELTGGDGDSGAGAVIGFIDADWKEVTTTIKDVHVDSTVAISGSASGAGGLVGKCANHGNASLVVENCSFNGTINASNALYVGGIVGYVNLGRDLTIENCAVNAAITGANSVGGLVGRLISCNAVISNCLTKGTITATKTMDSGNKYYTSAIIGITKVYEDMTVKIGSVIAAVNCNSHEALITTIWEENYADAYSDGVLPSAHTVRFELDNIVYDSDVQTPSSWIRRNNRNQAKAQVNDSSTVQSANWELENQISKDYFRTTAKSSSDLKGKQVFAFWTAVEGDYPTPPTVSVDSYNGVPSTDYVVDGNNIIISTAEQLMGVASKIAASNEDNAEKNFTGKTIKLTTNIVINQGDASTWGDSSPAYRWNATSVSWGGRFAGNFDGQGYTVSGLYNGDAKNAGFIGRVKGGNTIQNLNIVNSYFKVTGGDGDAGVGTVIGLVDPSWAAVTTTIKNVHVESTVTMTGTANGAGGLIGKCANHSGASLVIENCSVNSSINAGSGIGGLIGRINTGAVSATISDCLVVADINASKADTTAGLIGYYHSDEVDNAQISNTLVSVRGENVQAVVLSHWGDSKLTLTLDNVKYDSNRWNGSKWRDVYTSAGDLFVRNYNAETDLVGMTTAEFAGIKVFDYWTAVKGDYPTPPAVSGPDTYNGYTSTAYVTNGDTITIYTAEQLMGIAKAISDGNTFSGKTIKLNRDIVINKGDVSTWTSPYEWTAFSNTWDNRFAGNFDGQGHVISGIYSKHAAAAGLFGRTTGGNTVQNVSIVNSYFESTGSGDTGVGAIFGFADAGGGALTATIKNVHVEATIVGSSSNVHSTGGLVGRFHASDGMSVVIENCSFNGTITSAGNKVGGLIGGLSATNLSITNCSVNANITAQKTAGGLVGRALKVDNTTISDCLVVADINVTEADTTAGVIGYYATEYAAGNATISDTLVSVRGENVLAVSLGHWGKDGKMLTVTLDNVKYDSSRFNGNKAREIYTSAGDLLVQNGNLSAMTSAQIKGNAIFDGWTAVKGDYPVPTSAIDPLKAFVFESYGSATEVLGYQIKNNGDGTYGVRLIATLTNALDANYVAAGFKDIKVTLTNGEVKVQPIYHCMYSYNSVMGGGATYNAADYLADKFFCLTIDNAPATIASIEATPFVMTGEGTEPVCGEAVSWTLVETEPADQITVMSLNVYLHDDADPDGDGPATAQDRLNGIQAQVLAADPDVLCVQEDNWSETLDELLIDNGYTAVRGKAISRSSSDSFGISYTYEYLTIYYKTGEFTVGAKGQKWLSDTPDTQYSDSYGNENTRPRGFNYVELTSVATGETFFVFNTHLENSSIGTRKDQANKLIELVGQIAGETPYIICGDFNVSSNPNDESGNADHKATLSALLAAFDNTRLTAALTDTHATHINAEGKIFGVADKTVTPTSGTIIDYCFTSKGDFNVYSYDVVAEKQNGIYTSDHLPIVIKLAIKSAE